MCTGCRQIIPLATEFGPGKLVPCEIIFSKENVKFLAENFNLEDNLVYECKRAEKLGIWLKFFNVIITNYNPSNALPVFFKLDKNCASGEPIGFFRINT